MSDARKRRKGSPQRPKPGRGSAPARRRRARGRGPLVAFGVLFVLLLLGSMLFGGIGQADVPDDAVAVVEDTPGGTTEITREEFDRALEQVAANERIREVPEEGTDEYKRLAEAAMQQLINTAWVTGEAEEQGVSVSDRDVQAELDAIIQQFGCSPDDAPEDCEELQRRLNQFKLTLPEVEQQILTGLLGQELEREIKQDAARPTDEQIEDYYEAFKSQFAVLETRDVRLVLNSDKAKVEEAKTQLEEDSSKAAWERIAKEFSTDTSKSQGGLREGLTEGLVEEPLNKEIFEAEIGEIVGPVKTPLGYYVFELLKIIPAHTTGLDDCAVAGGTPGQCPTVRDELRTQLKQQLDAQARDQFINAYGSRWTARTVCADGFLFERCDNAGGENDFASRQEERQLEQQRSQRAPVLASQSAWPKPPNTLSPPLGAVGPSGTQIICYLANPAEGQPDPLSGPAPPQRPHPPGDLDAKPRQTPGQVDSETCGLPSPLGLTGSLPGAGGP